MVPLPYDDPKNFLLRALNLWEKILFASKQDGNKVTYDARLSQAMFLHNIETGLLSNTLRESMISNSQRLGLRNETIKEAKER